jgi:para-aminobenzoate synthetase component 2
MRVLLIDNRDSFTRNLEHLLVAAIPGARVDVRSYDGLSALLGLNGRASDAPDLVVISPGPGSPEDYPTYAALWAAPRPPVLGICLGMQLINHWRGGRTEPLPDCVHGRTEAIDWRGERRAVARYHSLHVTEVGQGLEVLAVNDAGVIMALGSKKLAALGYQFHPESFLTPHGGEFIAHALDFLDLS